MSTESPVGSQASGSPGSPIPPEASKPPGPLRFSPPVASSSQPEHPDAITPAPSQAMSSSSPYQGLLGLTSPRRPPGTPNEASQQRAHNPATGPWTSVPNLAPLQQTGWEHPPDWTMPERGVLLDYFNPILAQAISDSMYPREGRCFCALVLYEAQKFLKITTPTVNLVEDHPENKSNFFDTLQLFMTATAVDVFKAACRRHEERAGSGAADSYLRQGTIAHHVSELVEKVVVNPNGMSAEQAQSSTPYSQDQPAHYAEADAFLEGLAEDIYQKDVQNLKHEE